MMKPKAALVKDGFKGATHTWTSGDENKRGRLPLDAIERLKVLAGKGWDIEGYEVSRATESKPAEVTKVKVQTGEKVVHEVTEYRSEHDTEAYRISGKDRIPVGMRQVCNGCGNSLVGCPCGRPRVWVDFQTEGAVYFTARKTPLPPKKW